MQEGYIYYNYPPCSAKHYTGDRWIILGVWG